MGMTVEQTVEVIEAVKTDINWWAVLAPVVLAAVLTWLFRRKRG